MLEKYEKMLHKAVKGDECYPTPAIFRGEEVVLASYAIDGTEIIRDVCRRLRTRQIHEILLGLDSFTLPHQGTMLPSAVIVFHLRAGESPRIGVMEYQGDEAQPINWDNAYWNKRYSKLAADISAALTPEVQV